MMKGGSSTNCNADSSNSSLQNELELLLLQQQNRRIFLEREMDLNINRSGSAPPTVDGALRAAGNLFKNPIFEQFDDNARISGGNNNATSLGFLTEEEIRSHPAYLEYYYSNENLNPRLPPPLLSKEDWRVAQRVSAAGFGLGGIGDWRDKNSIDNDVRTSLFSMQPGLSVKKAEDDLVELRKAALRNISRKSSAELHDRGSVTLGGASSSGMGGRRKSFADILQEGLSRPKSNLSRPASQNSIGDVWCSTGISNANAVEIQNRVESVEAMLPQKSFTSLSSSQSISSAPNAPSSGIFELADIAGSLSGLSVSKSQRHDEDILNSSLQMRMAGHKHNLQPHYLEKSRADQLVDNISYAHLSKNKGSTLGLDISNSRTHDQMSSPGRTSSPTNRHPQLNPSDYASLEALKILYQGNSYPGMDVSGLGRSGYAVNQKPDMMFNNDLTAGSLLSGATGHNQRSGNQAGMHFPVADPDQYHYLRVPGNSSQGRYVGSPHGHEDLQGLEKAYLEALLMQQNQQYFSQFLHKPGNINHQYHGNPSFGPSYQGNGNINSFHSTVSSGSPMFQNEKSARFCPTDKSIKGESSGSLHSQTGNNVKGKPETLLEVVKNNKTKSLELSDVLNHVVEFSTDQYGSRFIQQKLETATDEEKMKIFTEIIPHARTLMIDVFGNYVIQKFFEHGTESQRKELARHLIGHVLPLSLQMYGCRVIQKALEVVDVDLQTQMVAELNESVMKCVRDQNGNHVIQKCIECVPQDRIQFIISSFLGQVVTLSTHPYGCRVIQRVLEHCVDPKTQTNIMDEIMSSVCYLAQDQYGNYVLQHVLQHGKPHERSAIISKLAGQIVQMSQQKFASNVIEKCLTFGGPEERKLLVNEMLGSTSENEPLQAMMKDPFGNYVVQKVLEICDDSSRELILSRIKVHLTALKRYTYGKHIVSRVEKLVATGEKHRGLSSNSC